MFCVTVRPPILQDATPLRIVMSFGMLKGKIFSKPTAHMGIIGSTLLLVYVVLVTFVPAVKNMAVVIAVGHIPTEGYNPLRRAIAAMLSEKGIPASSSNDNFSEQGRLKTLAPAA